MKIRAILLFIFIFLLNSMAFSGAGNDNSQSFIVNKLKPICDLCRANEVRDFASYKEFQQYVETNELYRSFLKSRDLDLTKINFSQNKTYKKISKLIEKTFYTLKSLFPKYILANKPPDLILFEQNRNFGFAIKTSIFMEDEIAPNAFVLSKGMLKLSEGALIGVIAHELTHLYLQKGENNFDNLYYFAYDELRHQGRVAPNLELSKKIGYYRTYMEIVGPFSAETLSGIPFDFRNMHESADDTLRYLLRSKVDAQECRPLIENYDKLYENLWLGVEMVDNRQELVNVDSFKDLVDKVEVELKTCFGNQKISLKELVIRSYDVSSSVYDWNLKLMPSEKLQIIKMAEKLFEQKSLTEALLELTRYARAEMRRFEAENNVSQIRYYSSEDHADEIALQVLYALDVPVEPFNDFFVNGLEGADEEVYVCNLEVEPFYGFLDDDHKNDCWRVYRNQRYYQWLKENNNNSDLGR